ncbi:helix-turn-helix transcriptional regulator [Aureimonas ureilytica]|uniref:helix-turn-helix transcriptional regulator n=1 Tax=Aureimonas ureilytica TaxID=401562 RepID=UPI0009E9F371
MGEMSSWGAKTPSSPLLSVQDVMSRLRVSRTTLWRMEHDEGFPKPITFGRRMKRWKEADIEAFIAVQAS